MHDELIAHVVDKDAEAAIWLFNVVHAYCWALLAYNTNVVDLCQVNMFFDDAKISYAFTKHVNDGTFTRTVSNPDETVRPDKVFTIWDLADKQLDKQFLRNYKLT